MGPHESASSQTRAKIAAPSEARRNASSQNSHKYRQHARTFTVLPSEQQEKFDALRRDLINQMQPANGRQFPLRAQINRELNRDYKQYGHFKKQDAATAHDALIPPYPDVPDDDMSQPPTPEADVEPTTLNRKPEPEPTQTAQPPTGNPEDENSSNEGNEPPVEFPPT